MQPLKTLTSKAVVLAEANVDTDQIIPARFLTTTSRDGLGRALFADRRHDASGAPLPDFPLNQPKARGRRILMAGPNFGCGSSREHAPWALLDYGFRAVISTGIADIFTSNALRNGLLPVVVDETAWHALAAQADADLCIDLEAQRIAAPDGQHYDFDVEAFGRYCLLNGTDPLGFLLAQGEAVDAYEREPSWSS